MTNENGVSLTRQTDEGKRQLLPSDIKVERGIVAKKNAASPVQAQNRQNQQNYQNN